MVKQNKYQREIEKLLQASERNVSKELYQMYKGLADEISKEIIALQKEIDETDKFSKKLLKERLEAIRDQMDRKIRIVEQDQKSSIWSFLRYNGDTAYNSLFYEFEMSEKIPLAFGMLSDKQLNVIINTPVASRKLSTRLKGNASKMKKNLNRVLVQGFGKGLSTQKMARQIADIGGAEYRRAMNIARTEAGRVTGVTRQQSQNYAKELGVYVKKEWISTLDGRTRHNHRELDGQVREVDEYFEINGRRALQPHMFGVASEDVNCRCVSISVIEGYDPLLRRDNETHEVINFKNYKDWQAAKGEPVTDSQKKWESAVADILKSESKFVTEDKLKSLNEEWQQMYREYSRMDTEYNQTDNADPEELNKLIRKMNAKRDELLAYEATFVQTNADIIKEILAQYRSMGIGEIDMKGHLTNGRAAMSKKLMEAYDYYPTEWIKRSADYGTITTKKVKRGYYMHDKNAELALSDHAGIHNSLRTAIHELAHRQEHISDSILRVEKEFYEHRTKGEALAWLGKGYRKTEVTRFDDFIEPYMGKDYGGRAYELLSMGIETLFADPTKLMKDKEMFEWVLKVLLTK